MAAAFPGSHNVFVPDHRASGKMVIDFARNPKDFAINRYLQVVPSDVPIGLYLEMTVEVAGRIVNGDLSDFAWPDGNDAPSGAMGTESHNWRSYRCERYAYPFRIGNQTVKNASWDIVAKHAAMMAQLAMTARTQLAATLLQTAGNWPAAHTAAVSAISGNTGTWAQSTTARSDIKRSLNYARETILNSTLAAVDPNDLHLVIGSGCAKAISESQEIIDYIKGSPDALEQVKGGLGKNALYGLPDMLYGVPLEVEVTRKVTSKKGATRAVSSVWANDKPVLMSRPGGLEGVGGAPSFSTATAFAVSGEEMLVEKMDDVNNKRVDGRVVDNIVIVLTAPTSGFLFTSAV